MSCQEKSLAPAQVDPRKNFINQAEPYASFHPFSEGLQHALCPDRTFHPTPLYGAGFSRLLSRLRHCHGVSFIRYGHRPSTFLHPFAPRALPRFFAPTGALTPARGTLRTHAWGNEHPPCPRQVSLVHTARPSMHSVTKHLTRPVFASVLPAQRDRLPDPRSAGFAPSMIRSGLRPLSAGSSQRAAESCSSSYGLHVRLRLLSTPHHNDAVTIGYRERVSPGGGLSPPSSRLLPGARTPVFTGVTTFYEAIK